MRGRFRRWLGSPRIVLVAALLAGALTLPSLSNGLGVDDHLYRARVVGDEWPAGRSARELFVFADPGDPAERTRAMERGELSWWAAPELRWGFLRPLPALVHHAELRAFGRGGAAWMHLHSVLWFVALAAAAGLLYRRMFGASWVSGLATLLYAIDDGHGFAVGWLANRCAVMGSCFAVLAVVAHDRWRRDGWRAGAAWGPAALAVALACSEQMVAALGFVVAHALTLDPAPARRRLAAIAPYAALAAAWFAVRAAMGYGSDGTGSYTDPFAHPLAFAAAVVERAPILAHSQLGALPADLWEVLFVRRGLTWVMVVAGIAFVGLLALLFRRLVVADRVTRFWVIGGALALVVVCGAHPNDRHLLLVGVAGSALVARFCAAWLDRARLPRGAGIAAIALLFIHAVAAPILLPVRARFPGAVARGVERIDTRVPSDAALAEQDLVLVAVPFKYLCNFASVVRRSNGGVSPRHWRCLAVASDDLVVERPDRQTLVLHPAHGFLRYFEDTNVRARSVPFSAGDRVELPGFTIEVITVTADGRPDQVAFQFAVPLEDPSLRWLIWRDGAYRPFTPPAIGRELHVAGQAYGFGDLMADEDPP